MALFGSLAPRGAVLKRAAASARLCEAEGRAVVFASLEDLAQRIDDPALDARAEDFLVLQNAGPKSGAAMPEAGYLPIPAKLARDGVKDMVRISDARMSGTAFGTIVLHVTPEAADGGPLGLVTAAIACGSAWPSAASIFSWTRPSSLSGAVCRCEGARQRAVMPSFFTIPCCRRTVAATSISCSSVNARERRWRELRRRCRYCLPGRAVL